MSLEERLQGALRRSESYQPSTDLFARVQRTIEEDAQHRRRVRRVLAATGAGALLLAGWVAVTADWVGGRPLVPWWSIEVALNALLVTLVVVLGPLIKRFGTGYARDVFRANGATADRFLALFDIAYYLVFVGYLLLTLRFRPYPAGAFGAVAPQMYAAAARIGGLLLLMGVLHSVAIAALPVLGLVFGSSHRRAVRRELGESAPPVDPRAEAADRVATVLVWGIAGLGLVGALLLGIPAFLAWIGA